MEEKEGKAACSQPVDVSWHLWEMRGVPNGSIQQQHVLAPSGRNLYCQHSRLAGRIFIR